MRLRIPWKLATPEVSLLETLITKGFYKVKLLVLKRKFQCSFNFPKDFNKILHRLSFYFQDFSPFLGFFKAYISLISVKTKDEQ